MNENNEIFQIVRAQPKDASLIVGLITAVWESMENREWFAPDDVSFVEHLLTPGNGMAWKAVEESSGKLAGILNVALPGESEENLGWDAGFSAEDLIRSAHIDSVAILPEFRGKGLQHRMMQKAEEMLRQQGIRYLFCTVHPENHFSRNNMVKQGFGTLKVTEKYGGLKREIMIKELA